MNQNMFQQVPYDVSTLIDYIAMGEIGLPEIQRPFVWPNKKVRDLFDSMYRGYPVGHLLLWKNGAYEHDHGRTIGTDAKPMVARLLVIDGQQRLTSLYAILKGIPVLRENLREELIQIAFHPMEEKFEVVSAAIQRDPTWIPDISVVWAEETNIFDLVEEYLAGLSGEMTPEKKRRIQEAIHRLSNLKGFPFTALQLSANLDEEMVADVFVRINSKATPLNQADFILTLMSVFHNDQRSALEEFCRQSRTPSRGRPSPFNYFLEPEPDNLLRVSVGFGFRRARLQAVYSILRGKDLETGQFSDERREQQFAVLKEAFADTLDLQNWHEFLKTLDDAGYRSGQVISSRNAILFSYVFFLIGKRDYRVGHHELAGAIARWFFFVALTGRYTDSPETRMEEDLADLREIRTAEAFIDHLDRQIRSTFTNDYWEITLPSDLVTSSARSPGLFAYYAALVLLDAEVLLSNRKIARLLEPSARAKRAAVERHHLFPKAHLKRQGISSVRETNQIANYALVEWPDNADISDQAPGDYYPLLIARLTPEQRERQMRWHALPAGWETMSYPDFLRERRRLMAGVIRAGFDALCHQSAATRAQAPEAVAEPGADLAAQVLDRLDGKTRELFQDLLEEPPEKPENLEQEIYRYLEELEHLAANGSDFDLDGAHRLAERLLALLAELTAEQPEPQRSLVQAAVRYFVLDEDAEPDVRSRSGFSDDETIVSLVEAVVAEGVPSPLRDPLPGRKEAQGG